MSHPLSKPDRRRHAWLWLLISAVCVVCCDDGLLCWQSYGCLTLILPRRDPPLQLAAARMQKLCQSSFSLQPNGTASVLSSQKRCQIFLSTLIFDCGCVLATRQSFSLCSACAFFTNRRAIRVSCKHVAGKNLVCIVDV